ncbi:hypothetical protein DSO57_1039507 [Entomophthora muscae]|uniref:Uncharacterized protein n=1 Tax=Entomophthora muscae TaxID=34485 RepID=A0ACC2RP90_9FUNG|nr:hypothetical protein DSO57_1039507 [Entomophthora muscae]
MGVNISKLSIQALAVSHIAMYCSAAPTLNMTTADTTALDSPSGIAYVYSYNRKSLVRGKEMSQLA